MEDKRIVDLYWARDPQAIEQSQARYGTHCHRIALRILDNRQDAEECVNDTFLRAWNAIPPQKPARLGAFLGRITRHLALDRYEQRTADKRGGGQIALLLDELQECLPDGEDVAEEVQLKDLLDRFLSTLPATARRLFLRRYWYAYSIEEIGRMEGMTPNRVAVSLYRTREKLKVLLQEEGVTL